MEGVLEWYRGHFAESTELETLEEKTSASSTAAENPMETQDSSSDSTDTDDEDIFCRNGDKEVFYMMNYSQDDVDVMQMKSCVRLVQVSKKQV